MQIPVIQFLSLYSLANPVHNPVQCLDMTAPTSIQYFVMPPLAISFSLLIFAVRILLDYMHSLVDLTLRKCQVLYCSEANFELEILTVCIVVHNL